MDEGIGGSLGSGGCSRAGACLQAARYFVTDANATFTAGIGAIVAAGGANK